MRISLKRIAAGLTAAATVSSMLLTVAPVHASQPTLIKDTMTREKVSVAATHTLQATLPAFQSNEYVVFNYTSAGFALYASAPSCSLSSGVCSAVTSTTSTTITCTSGPCSGTLTLGTFAGDNPATAGSKLIPITSDATAGISGSFAIPIVDSDQVTVTASVDASITFDIDTAVTDTETAAPYTVALGSLTTAAVSGSDESGINSIWLDLDTNASGGAVVTVSSTNAALKSAAVPGDTIPSASAQMSPGTANYGICVKTASAVVGSATSVAPFNNAICDQTPVGNIVGGVTVSPQAILNTNSLPLQAGRAEIMVDAAISTTTAAHTDYSDILKFIATGTF